MTVRDAAGFSDLTDVSLTEVAALDQLQAATAQLPRNQTAWTYTILGLDKTPYITRTLLPRVDGQRTLVHYIHRADQDEHPHNHPWRRARFRCVSGGYTDERWEWRDGVWIRVMRLVRPGDLNQLDAGDFHRAVDVLPGTRTVGVVGERVQDWGFLVDGLVVPHERYFAQRGHTDLGGIS